MEIESDSKLAIFDFDYTIINANSTKYLNKLVIEKEKDEFKKSNKTPSIANLNRFKYSEEIESLKNELDYTIMHKQIFKYMFSKHRILKQNMEKCLKEIKINDSMKYLIKFLHQSGFDLIIVSDSSSFLIETILKFNNLLEFFGNGSKIFSNKSCFDQDGCLNLIPFNQIFNINGAKFDCSTQMCRNNICKGSIIQSYLKNNRKSFVTYVGDGKIDFCPSLSLNQNDIFFVKKNSSLSKLLENASYLSKIKAKIKYWKNANEILNQLK